MSSACTASTPAPAESIAESLILSATGERLLRAELRERLLRAGTDTSGHSSDQQTLDILRGALQRWPGSRASGGGEGEP